MRLLSLIAMTIRKKTSLLTVGWSSLVARQAHNLKVVGSNPAPATNFKPLYLFQNIIFSFHYPLLYVVSPAK